MLQHLQAQPETAPVGMFIASKVAAIHPARSVDCGPLSKKKKIYGSNVYGEAEPCLPDCPKRGYGSDDPYDRSVYRISITTFTLIRNQKSDMGISKA